MNLLAQSEGLKDKSVANSIQQADLGRGEDMDVILVVHVEEDPLNEKGARFQLPVGDQSLRHVAASIKALRYEVREVPLNIALKYGGSIGDRLVKSRLLEILPQDWEIELHPHGEVLTPEGWIEGPCSPEVIKQGLRDVSEALGVEPRGLVFGDWLITEEGLRAALEVGVSHDASYTPYRFNESFVVKPPFNLYGLVEVPTTSDGKYPLNPLVDPRTVYLAEYIVKEAEHKAANCLLHFFFHSYDLFSFYRDGYKLRMNRLKLLRKLLNLLSRKGARFLHLSEVRSSYDYFLKEIRQSRLEKAKWLLKKVSLEL